MKGGEDFPVDMSAIERVWEMTFNCKQLRLKIVQDSLFSV